MTAFYSPIVYDLFPKRKSSVFVLLIFRKRKAELFRSALSASYARGYLRMRPFVLTRAFQSVCRDDLQTIYALGSVKLRFCGGAARVFFFHVATEQIRLLLRKRGVALLFRRVDLRQHITARLVPAFSRNNTPSVFNNNIKLGDRNVI